MEGFSLKENKSMLWNILNSNKEKMRTGGVQIILYYNTK